MKWRRVNKAMMRPILILGVEKRLFLLNGLLSFPLIAATHLAIPACFVGVGFFLVCHLILRQVSQADPFLGVLFKRSTRYIWQAYFPAKSHPSAAVRWHLQSVSCPKKESVLWIL